MYARQLGFASSWKMLTRDKGWIKPLLVLTLVGWIPILGQIAILGFGLEWARLTAWGVDAAPKQRGVAYGAVLSTGGIAFLITVTMGLVLGIVDLLLFGGWYPIAAFPMGAGVFSSSAFDIAHDTSIFLMLVILVVNLLMGTFTTAAMMRATIYDSFSAGWRVDRLFQMIGRDPGGFLHAYAVSLIGGLVTTVYSLVISLAGSLLVMGGAVGVGLGVIFGADVRGGDAVEHVMMSMGPGIIVMGVVIVVSVLFIGGVVNTAMQLISINAVGQWFCRFEVGRWDVSSAPLPEGVPGSGGWSGRAAASKPPVPPESGPQQPAADDIPPVKPEAGLTPNPDGGVGEDTSPVQGE